MLECISYGGKQVILYRMPEVGDNFKIANDQTVYYFSGNGKYSYPSADCYFKLGNPPFETDYRAGGIKVIISAIANPIPLLGSMCGNEKIKMKGQVPPPSLKRFLSTDYLLFHFSNPSHLCGYFLLSLSILYRQPKKKRYWFTFLCCFTGGALLEGVQYFFIPGRTASFEDQLLNIIGSLLGMGLFCVLQLRAHKLFDIHKSRN